MQDRLVRLRAALAEHDLPALLVTAPANRRYLSGFTGSAGTLLVTPTAALLFSDGRYSIQARQEAPAFELHQVAPPEQSLPILLAAACAALGLRRMAVEAAHTTVAAQGMLLKALPEVELIPVEGLVETLREQKDATELATLRRAIALTDAALQAVIPRLTPQTSEREAAWMLEIAMRVGGAEAIAFPIIVAAGPNAALPHAHPSDAPLGTGQPIVIDMGARIDGYHADLTRTIVLGEPDARFHTIYATVLKAQQQAISGLRPGLTTDQADALARDVIASAGYAEAFSHSLGHGVGLEIHEGPFMRRAGPESPSRSLHENMVVSVEPGIYLEGWGGVRIEDLVLITTHGCEVLSQAPKE